MQHEKPPLMFWAISAVGLLWNLAGCWNYLVQTNPEAVAQMPELYRVVIENRPVWAQAGFAVSVFAGAVGCILMLLRRKIATQLLVLSLLGTIAVFYFGLRVFGFDPATFSALVMSLALLWFSTLAARRGWTR